MLGMKCVFNCKCTPAFNIIETVFADMKFDIRRANVNSTEGLIEEALRSLKKMDKRYMMGKLK